MRSNTRLINQGVTLSEWFHTIQEIAQQSVQQCTLVFFLVIQLLDNSDISLEPWQQITLENSKNLHLQDSQLTKHSIVKIQSVFENPTKEITSVWQSTYHSVLIVCTSLTEESEDASLAVHSFDDIPVSGTISSFGIVQIHHKVQSSKIKPKRSNTKLFLCNELDDYFNTKY